MFGRQGEEYGERAVYDQAEWNAEPSERQADEVHQRSERVLLRDGAGGGGERVVDQAM